jgi:hypothetical protein
VETKVFCIDTDRVRISFSPRSDEFDTHFKLKNLKSTMDWNGIQRKLQEDARQREEDQRRARQQVHLQRIQEMVAVQQRLT